jgi:hypothetical protein
MTKSTLRLKVEARVKQLESDLAALRAEGGRNEDAERIEESLAMLLKAVRDGWDEVGEHVARRLGYWLKTTEDLVR